MNTWQNISKERGEPLNDQYFVVYCETNKKKHELKKYRKSIRKCLMQKLNEEQTERLMKLYKDDLEDFYKKKKWTPGTAALSMI